MVKRHCFPVYWNGEDRRVLRGHWFARKGGLDWLPLREDVAEQLEFAYRSKVFGITKNGSFDIYHLMLTAKIYMLLVLSSFFFTSSAKECVTACGRCWTPTTYCQKIKCI